MEEQLFTFIMSAIAEQLLSEEHEETIFEVLGEKIKNKQDAEFYNSLVGAIVRNLDSRVARGEIQPDTRTRYLPILHRCFDDHPIAQKDAELLNRKDIDDFIIDIVEGNNFSRNEYICFCSLLKMGLSQLRTEGAIQFDAPSKLLNYKALCDDCYISNPYSEDETIQIIRWIDSHPEDSRGLAIGLWFSGEISPDEIINLRVEDLENNESRRFYSLEKEHVIALALMNHGITNSYVFMSKKNGEWTKLTDKSLSVKLYYVCQELGIVYKPIHKNDKLKSYQDIQIGIEDDFELF